MSGVGITTILFSLQWQAISGLPCLKLTFNYKLSSVCITPPPQSHRGRMITFQISAISYCVSEAFFWLLYKFSICPNCCWSPRRSIGILLFSKPTANLISWVLSLVLSFLPFSGTLFHLPSLSGSPGFPLATGYKYAYSTLYSTLLTYSKKLSHLLIPCHHQIYEKCSAQLSPQFFIIPCSNLASVSLAL